jgi:hypothetical protein
MSSSFRVWAIYRFYFVIVYTKNIIFILYEKFILNYIHFFTMTKTMTIGLVALAIVAGSIMTGTMAEAKKEDNGNPFQVVLDAIAALQLSVDGIDTSGLATQTSVDDIDTVLLSTTSFYQVEDIVNFVGGPDRNFDILVSLSCPGSVPAEVQAFTIETMGVQVSHLNDDNQVAFFNSTVIDQSFGFFYGEAVSEFIGSNLVYTGNQFNHKDGSATTIGASEEVRFGGNVVNIDDPEEIKLKAVAIGEKPLGCDVTIDADAAHLGLPLPPP